MAPTLNEFQSSESPMPRAAPPSMKWVSHLPRPLYIARGLGLEAEGVEADRRSYPGAAWQTVRESAARIKAFLEVLVERRPKYLGPVLPISGDGTSTHDRRD